MSIAAERAAARFIVRGCSAGEVCANKVALTYPKSELRRGWAKGATADQYRWRDSRIRN